MFTFKQQYYTIYVNRNINTGTYSWTFIIDRGKTTYGFLTLLWKLKYANLILNCKLKKSIDKC